MCGIAGVFYWSDSEVSTTAVEQMTEQLSHRGPNASGIFQDKNLVLGHRRLSIIDLNEASNQPFVSEDKRYALVYNGELYNFKAIKEKLSDFHFRTDSDTEVILAAYQRWGADCLQHFNGMFAFALWDSHKEELFIGRDRLGIKPLYFYRDERCFAFASELRALLQSDLVPRKINRAALSDYIRYQTVHGPHCMIKNVQLLDAGSYLMLKDEEVKKQLYWKAEAQKGSENYTDYEKNKSSIQSLFFAAVEKRMLADVPLGAFLSGGIDSSAIVAAMSQMSERSVNTFSVVFDEADYSEAEFSDLVAEKFQTNHHQINLSAKHLLDSIPAALNSMDHPSGDGVNTYVVSKATKEAGITVALSGLGGDEVFSGYPIFNQMPELMEKAWLQSWPKGIRKGAGTLLQQLKPSLRNEKLSAWLQSDYFDLQHLYPIGRQLIFDKRLKKLLKGNLQSNHTAQLAKQLLDFKQPLTELPLQSRISVLEFSTYMQHVLLRDADQMSMAHALEVRLPFLDHELVSYLLNVPDKHKLGAYPKALLVDSLGDLLPKEVYERKKMGFVMPWEEWIKNELQPFCEEQLNFLKQSDLFQPASIEGMWNGFLKNSKRISWVSIWSLVVLAYWMKHNKVTS
ncbi:MAG: asparagine synthase (glutamine-hydrolyzing) [Vicingaceae bacterium]